MITRMLKMFFFRRFSLKSMALFWVLGTVGKWLWNKFTEKSSTPTHEGQTAE